MNDYTPVKQYEKNANKCAQASLLCANRSVNNKKQEESFVEAFQAKACKPINLKKRRKKRERRSTVLYGKWWKQEELIRGGPLHFVWSPSRLDERDYRDVYAHKHTHTHMIYIHIYTCVCVNCVTRHAYNTYAHRERYTVYKRKLIYIYIHARTQHTLYTHTRMHVHTYRGHARAYTYTRARAFVKLYIYTAWETWFIATRSALHTLTMTQLI